MKWLFVALVLVGDLLVVWRSRIGFVLWVICDGYFCANSYLNDRIAESVVFFLYTIVGFIGYARWKVKE